MPEDMNNITPAMGKKEIKCFDKALMKAHAKHNPQFDQDGRHAFVVLSIFDDDTGVNMMVHKIDKKTINVTDSLTAMKEGGVAGYIATGAMHILSGTSKELGSKAIEADAMFRALGMGDSK